MITPSVNPCDQQANFLRCEPLHLPQSVPSSCAATSVQERHGETSNIFRGNQRRIGADAAPQSTSIESGSKQPSPSDNAQFENKLPCRARRMPLDHNFKNAYFIVTEKTGHGDKLVCSYPECAAAGSKFRYCTVCRIPISQRNFYQNHSHADILTGGQISEELRSIRNDRDMTRSPQESKRDVLQNASTNHRGTNSETFIAPSPPGAQEQQQPQGRLKDHMEHSNCPESSARHLGEDEDGRNKRREAWMSLLYTRPRSDDEAAFSAWLMKVMAVSDPAHLYNGILQG
eukprot:CAMPEP_0176128440 /NCGR_PEP_ID=MMETSP0120_2-20121206/64902_1 /TAXON_ID=160619 /ORGANISM="Kryptoperidinium foliaceum, Strain CCMP 1326" /LENGTH=286 /DNA_ID=CAMNT_0017463537 /DNA_START=204 /DNA_END=1064 /DNA_ORIENTATION=+